MNFGAARLGFWFVNQGLEYFPPRKLANYYWSSNQLVLQPNTYAILEFNPNGTITVTYNQIAPAIPLIDLPLYWKQNGRPGSDYEIRATVQSPTFIEGNGSYQVFGGTINTPTIGNSTAWLNLGTQRTLRVDLAGDAAYPDYTALVTTIDIGLAGTSTTVISDNFLLDIGAV